VINISKVVCPFCGKKVNFEDYDYNDDLYLTFKCEDCNYKFSLTFDAEYQIKLILKALGFSDEEIREIGVE